MFVAVNKVNLYYESINHSDDTLVLLHGNGEDHTIFNKLVEKLSKDYRIILVDSRSHGKSSYVSYLTYEDMMEDIHDLILTLHLHRVSILGFSDGANIAMLLASKYPFLIKKLILCGPNASVSGFKLTELVKLKKDYLVSSDDKIRLMLEQEEITSDMLSNIDCPTLILAGQHDVIKEKHFNYIKDCIPNSSLKIIKKADHYNYIVNSDQAYVDIDMFLRKG